MIIEDTKNGIRSHLNGKSHKERMTMKASPMGTKRRLKEVSKDKDSLHRPNVPEKAVAHLSSDDEGTDSSSSRSSESSSDLSSD